LSDVLPLHICQKSKKDDIGNLGASYTHDSSETPGSALISQGIGIYTSTSPSQYVRNTLHGVFCIPASYPALCFTIRHLQHSNHQLFLPALATGTVAFNPSPDPTRTCAFQFVFPVPFFKCEKTPVPAAADDGSAASGGPENAFGAGICGFEIVVRIGRQVTRERGGSTWFK
jgi:hypothetical protein